MCCLFCWILQKVRKDVVQRSQLYQWELCANLSGRFGWHANYNGFVYRYEQGLYDFGVFKVSFNIFNYDYWIHKYAYTSFIISIVALVMDRFMPKKQWRPFRIWTFCAATMVLKRTTLMDFAFGSLPMGLWSKWILVVNFKCM